MYCVAAIGPEPEFFSDKPSSSDNDSSQKISNGNLLLNGKERSPVDQANAGVASSSSSNGTSSRPTVMASEVSGDQKGDEKLDGSASCKLACMTTFWCS